MRIAIVIILVCCIVAFSQGLSQIVGIKIGIPQPDFIGSTGFDPTSFLGAWFFNEDAALSGNDGVWQEGPRNLVEYSQDMDEWGKHSASWVGSQTDPDGGSNAWLLQEDTTTDQHRLTKGWTTPVVTGQEYTVIVVAKASGRDGFRFPVSTFSLYIGIQVCPADGTSSWSSYSSVNLGSDWWMFALNDTATSDGVPTFYAQMYETGCSGSYIYTGDGSSGVLFYQIALIPGTHTASEVIANGLYEHVDDGLDVTDYSGNGNTACPGGNCASTNTNQAQNSVGSYNLLNPGYSNDLTSAYWDYMSGASNITETSVDIADEGYFYVDDVPDQASGSYLLSATLSGTGTIALRARGTTNAQIAVELTATPTTYSILQESDVSYVGLDNRSIAGVGAGLGDVSVTAGNFQLTRVPSGYSGDPLPYRSSAEPVFRCRHCDYSTDDFTDVDSFALASDWTFHFGIRADDNTSVGLLSDAGSDPSISLDASGKVAYTNGTDTVTATNAVTAGLWHFITVTKIGDTVYHYLDGVANGSGDASSASNAFTSLRMGYDGSAYFDGIISPAVADDAGADSGTVLAAACAVGAGYWDYRATPFFGLDSGCADLDLSVAPLYAGLTPWQISDKMWASVRELYRRILPVPAMLEVRP